MKSYGIGIAESWALMIERSGGNFISMLVWNICARSVMGATSIMRRSMMTRNKKQ